MLAPLVRHALLAPPLLPASRRIVARHDARSPSDCRGAICSGCAARSLGHGYGNCIECIPAGARDVGVDGNAIVTRPAIFMTRPIAERRAAVAEAPAPSATQLSIIQ